MGIKGNLLLFVCLLVCLSMPAFAVEDLEAYTTAGNYITPAYGLFLESDYKYIKDGVGWENFGGNSYENQGYYSIFNSIDNYMLNYQMGIKSTLGGTVYICVDVSQYISPNLNYCHAIGVIGGGSSYELFGGQLDLQSLISSYYTNGGVLRYYYKLIHVDSSVVYSNFYTAYWDIDNMYSNYRLISISSTSNLSSGVITLTLNSSITKELNDSNCIQYDNDGSEQTLSGTLSCLLFTDSSKQKAYPYYIDNFYGGFYNYSRYSANSTTIKIFVNENVTSKGLYMYYNITNYNNALMLQGRFNDSDGRRDENNNPFVIHQVFSDWRWNGSFAKDIFKISATPFSYSRFNSTIISNGAETYLYHFANNITFFFQNTSIALNAGIKHFYNDSQSSYYVNRNGGATRNLQNQTGGRVNANTTYTTLTNLTFYINNSYVYGLVNNVVDILVPESNIRFSNYKSDFASGAVSYYYTDNTSLLSTTNTIFTPSNTTPLNISNTSITSIQFNSLTPSGTNINVIDLHIDVVTNVGGTLICVEDEYINQTVDSIAIPTDTTSTAIKTYNIILNHQITNETLFNSLSLVHYKCTFSRTDGAIFNDTIAVVIDTDKLFISNINPLNYHNYPDTSISATANFSYNYSTTDHPTLFGYSLFSLNCTSIYNHKCVKYTIKDVINLGTSGTSFSYFGITIPLILNPFNPSFFSSSTAITNNVQNNKCYLMGYAAQLANETIYGNFTDNLIYLNFCVNVNDNINGSGTGGTGAAGNTTSDINTWLINSLLSNSLQCYTNYTPSGSWDVIPHFNCAVSTIGYKMVTIMNSPQAEQLYLAFMIVFFSWFSFAMYIGFIIGNKIRRGDTDLKTCLGIGVLFEFVFIIGGLSSLNLLNIIFLLLSCGILYLISKK